MKRIVKIISAGKGYKKLKDLSKFCFKLLKRISYFLLIVIIFYFIFLMTRTLTNFSEIKRSVKLGQQIYLNSPKNVPVERTIEIVMGADDGYIQHSAATIASILLNCDSSSNFRFHILDGGMSSDKKEKLLHLKKLRDFDIQFYDMTKYDWSIFPDNRAHITLAAYYRLSILEVLSTNIQKALYLDGDMIVEQDLKELWDTDLSNYALGAVEDVEGIKSRNRLGLSNKYFNSGLLLLNLNKLRNVKLLNDSVIYLKKNRKRIIYQDQDILNGLFNDQYKDFPIKWNVNSEMYMSTRKKHVYTDLDAKIARANPAIIHFTGGMMKPWGKIQVSHPLADEYWKYLKYTEFYSPDQRKPHFSQLFLMHILLIKRAFKMIFYELTGTRDLSNSKTY